MALNGDDVVILSDDDTDIEKKCDEVDFSEDESWRNTWVASSTLLKESNKQELKNVQNPLVIAPEQLSPTKVSKSNELFSSAVFNNIACNNELANLNESQTTTKTSAFYLPHSIHNFDSRVVLSPVPSVSLPINNSTCSAEAPLILIEDSDDNDDDDNNRKKTFNSFSEKVHLKNKKSNRKLKIKSLVNQLERKERQIKHLAEMDISLEDMKSEESVYIQEARLKEEFLKLWRKYCKLIGENPDKIIKRKRVCVTSAPFPELNRSVERFINKHNIFPNLSDIKQICKKAVDNNDINVRENDLHNIAVDIFVEVGKKLQINRKKEFNEISGNYLTDRVKIEEDPALEDAILNRKLKQNRKLAKRRIENVFQDFVRQQYEQQALGSSNEAICKTDDEESDDHESHFDNSKQKLYSKSTNGEVIKIGRSPKDCLEETVIRVTVSKKEPLFGKKIGVTIGNPTGATNNKQSDIIKINNKSLNLKRSSEYIVPENDKQVNDFHINAKCDTDFSSFNSVNPLQMSSRHSCNTISTNTNILDEITSCDNPLLKTKYIPIDPICCPHRYSTVSICKSQVANYEKSTQFKAMTDDEKVGSNQRLTNMDRVAKDRVKLLKAKLNISLEKPFQFLDSDSQLKQSDKIVLNNTSPPNAIISDSKNVVFVLSSDDSD
ncbi:uncharacterized protein LOC105848108 isoform X1 [Hydra vulgaris]|uniref:uncharacterized protein LOC105848108 isoform X1 n=1 Tax=Hydra vulgaris TaxID=6087 RepID=UPI001F5F7DE4|nr:uncharacterized protein LOC105848108 [Hydra vulgaris]